MAAVLATAGPVPAGVFQPTALPAIALGPHEVQRLPNCELVDGGGVELAAGRLVPAGDDRPVVAGDGPRFPFYDAPVTAADARTLGALPPVTDGASPSWPAFYDAPVTAADAGTLGALPPAINGASPSWLVPGDGERVTSGRSSVLQQLHPRSIANRSLIHRLRPRLTADASLLHQRRPRLAGMAAVLSWPGPHLALASSGSKFLNRGVPPGQGLLWADSLPHQGPAFRTGWWFTDLDGDLTKVGEYQDLGPSLFWDTELLLHDDARTLDIVASGLDREATQADLSYFGPLVSGKFDYQRYLHRLDHDPLTNFGTMDSGESFVREDVDVGDDYAIRVQELNTHFKGRLTKNLKYRVNFWMLKKQGQRQASASSHCFRPVGESDRLCHVLSQGQQIDWLTTKIEPVLEYTFGPMVVEYSRPMRSFNQTDQLVVRDYGNAHGAILSGFLPYAIVPENVTQIDRLKIGVDLTANTHLYANLKKSVTHNKFRDTHRRYEGYDIRLTNRWWDGLTLTGYAKQNDQNNQPPPFRLPTEQVAPYAPTEIRQPVNYALFMGGVRGSWRPFDKTSELRGVSFTSGWEYRSLDRDFAWYQIPAPGDPGSQTLLIDQAHTSSNMVRIGMATRWSPMLRSEVWYKRRTTVDPLFGVREINGDLNTSLPRRADLVELRGTWAPTSTFFANASLGIENRHHNSEIANFDEDNYPITCSLWWAPIRKLSLSAGYGFYSNWIDQDVSLPSDDPAEHATRSRLNYGGWSHVVSFGGAYRYSRRLTLSGSCQFLRSRNAFDPFDPWPDLAPLSDVLVDQVRLSTGTDWWLREGISAFSRYRFEDYEDRSANRNSGTAHMWLTGLTAIY